MAKVSCLKAFLTHLEERFLGWQESKLREQGRRDKENNAQPSGGSAHEKEEGVSPFVAISATMGWETFYMVHTLWLSIIDLPPNSIEKDWEMQVQCPFTPLLIPPSPVAASYLVFCTLCRTCIQSNLPSPGLESASSLHFAAWHRQYLLVIFLSCLCPVQTGQAEIQCLSRTYSESQPP